MKRFIQRPSQPLQQPAPMTNDDSKRVFLCDCGKSYGSSSALYRHQRTSKDHDNGTRIVERYSCTICDTTCSRPYDLERHVDEQHGEGKTACPRCGKHIRKGAPHANEHGRTCVTAMSDFRGTWGGGELRRPTTIVENNSDQENTDPQFLVADVHRVARLSLPVLKSTQVDEIERATARQTASKRPRSPASPVLQVDTPQESKRPYESSNEGICTSSETLVTPDCTGPRVNTSLETPVSFPYKLRPHLKTWKQAQELIHFGNLGLSAKDLTCGLCGLIFRSKSITQLFSHLDEVHFKESEGPHTCKECEISFAYEKDLSTHLHSAKMGDCGFMFQHTQECTGHHPPQKSRLSRSNEESKRLREDLTDNDRFEFCYRVRHWEQAQVHANQDYLDRLAVALPPARKHGTMLIGLGRELSLSRRSLRTFSMLIPDTVKRLSAFSLNTWRSSHLRIDYSAPRPLLSRFRHSERPGSKVPARCSLCPAIRFGDLHSVVQEINRPGVNINCDCDPSSLHAAVEQDDAEIAALLLHNGAALDTQDALGDTPITKAIVWNLAEILYVLHSWDMINNSAGRILTWILGHIMKRKAPRPLAMCETVAGILLRGHAIECQQSEIVSEKEVLWYTVTQEDECQLRITKLLLQYGARVPHPNDIYGSRQRFAECPKHVRVIVDHLIDNSLPRLEVLYEWLRWVNVAARDSKESGTEYEQARWYEMSKRLSPGLKAYPLQRWL